MSGSQDVIELLSDDESFSNGDDEMQLKPVTRRPVKIRAISSESDSNESSDINERCRGNNESKVSMTRTMQSQRSKCDSAVQQTEVAPMDRSRHDCGMREITEGMSYHELQAQQLLLERIQAQNRRKGPNVRKREDRNEDEREKEAQKQAMNHFRKHKARKVAPQAQIPVPPVMENESDDEWQTFVKKAAQREAIYRQKEKNIVQNSRDVICKTSFLNNHQELTQITRDRRRRTLKRKNKVKWKSENCKTGNIKKYKSGLSRVESEEESEAESEEESEAESEVESEVESDQNEMSSEEEESDGIEMPQVHDQKKENRNYDQFKRSKVALLRKRPREKKVIATSAHDAPTTSRLHDTIETHQIKEKLSFTELQEQEKLLAFFRAQKRRNSATRSSKAVTNTNGVDDVVKTNDVITPGKAKTNIIDNTNGNYRGVSETTKRSEPPPSLSFISPPSRNGVSASNATFVSADCTATPLKKTEYPVIHSTAWRHLVFEEAPPNLIEVSITLYSSELDRPLWDYDKSGDMKKKCILIDRNEQRIDLKVEMQSLSQFQVNKRVRTLIARELPQIEKCHARRVRHVVKETRKQLSTYFRVYKGLRSEQYRRPQWSKIADRHSWSGSFPIEQRMAKRDKLDPTHTVDPYNCLVGDVRYFVHQNGSPIESVVYPETVTQLSNEISGIRRSFTMIGIRKNVFVEDDPVLRYVPYLGENEQMVIDNDLYTSTTMRKERRVAVFGSGDELKILNSSARDNEMQEMLLRIVVGICGMSDQVFLALQLEAKFARPQIDYHEIKDIYVKEQQTASRLAKVRELCAVKSRTSDILIQACQALSRLSQLCWVFKKKTKTPYLSIRLQPPLSVFESNYAHALHALGLRDRKTYEGVAEWYRDLFCRRCFTYDCSEHGIQNPQRSIRADPVYPMLRVSSVQLTRQEVKVQENGLENCSSSSTSSNNVDPIEVSTSSSEDEVKASESQPATKNPKYRRSRRTHTRISSLATNRLVTQERLLESERLAELKKCRKRREKFARLADKSEYLDNSYLPTITSTMRMLLSRTVPCSSSCCILFSEGKSLKQSDSWSQVDAVLVRKLATALGFNACIIAAVLRTPSCTCAQIETFLVQEKRRRDSGDFSNLEEGFPRQRKRRRQSLGTASNRFLAKKTLDRETKLSYKPCDHDGECGESCGCTKRGHACNRACSCGRDCPNRFQGCKCSVSKCQTSTCPCWSAGRECDPDYCFTCGASDVAVTAFCSEFNQRNGHENLLLCQNVNMLRGGIHKNVGVAFSATHGWGAYALEPIQKDEFVLEYTGELITDEEAERRGAIYDRKSISYLFGVNSEYVVDAARKGNKAKFANHKAKNVANLDVRIIASNGEHRIGLFANEAIEVGAELFFDYGYTHETAPTWSQRLKQGPEKRIYAVEDDENEWEQWE
ncbi:putative SET domain, tesmin/TSO1-like CXC domain, pre-SET CXC domain-containing protein [Plasmopara halstedii]